MFHKNKFIIAIVILIVAIGGYFGYRTIKGSKGATLYSLAAVEKGTLIVSVSGSGQVEVQDQIDITPKVSGELTALYVAKDQSVKTGQLVAVVDSSDAEKSIRDAQVALDDAKYTLTQAQKDYQDIETQANRTLTKAYEDGYDTASTAFFKLSGYMDDLKNTLGTEKSAQEYIAGYELVLGRNSSFTQKLIEDQDKASDLFNENFAFFRTVSREDATSTIYQLIGNTLETTKTISQALDSARHMFDAISLYDYENLRSVVTQVDTMQPKIQSDVPAVYSNIGSLQTVKDTIDDTNNNTPGKIEDARRAIQTAQNTVVKKQEALADAQEDLAKYSVYAPFNGIIALVGDAKKGDAVSANMVLATLITRQKIAQITLNEVDTAKVKAGQKATITFDALEDLTVVGKVIEVDTIGTTNQGVVNYGIQISLDTTDEKIKPGMSLTADIIIDAKSDILVLQSAAIKSQGDSYYVELVEVDNDESRKQLLANISGTILAKSPKMQQVETGISNDLSTEIVSGLKEGDIVVSSANNQTAQTQRNTQSQGFIMPGVQTRTFR